MDNGVQVGTGKSPEGVPVSYFEVDRPSTIGGKGASGYIIEVRAADGKRITHSDSLAGLKSAGYKVDEAVVVPPAPAPTPVPSPAVKPAEKIAKKVEAKVEKSIEEELE